MSSQFASMSIDTLSKYVDNVTGLDYSNPDYVIVLWIASGKGVLTAKLALFFICLMSGTGDAKVAFTYPELDSWMSLDNGHFMHNTSRDVASKLPRGVRLVEPHDDSAESEGSDAESDDDSAQSEDSGAETDGDGDGAGDGGEAGRSGSHFQHAEAGPSQPSHV